MRALPLLLLLLLGCSPAEQQEVPAAPQPTTATTPSPTPTPPPPPPPTPPPSRTPKPLPPGPVEGADISWPQCPVGMGIPERQGEGQPMPTRDARFVVLGLTNGPAFFPNPCLDTQVAFARERRLAVAAYAVANYPSAARLAEYGAQGPYDAETGRGRLSNVGFAQAQFNLATMKRVDLESPIVWVDVEPYPLFPWSGDVRANAAVVEGIVRAYQEAGLRVGFYSATGLWRTVLGTREFGLPEWRTAGRLGRADALERCEDEYSFQGGEAVLAQWYTDTRDFDVTCPGVPSAEWFTQY